MRVKQGLFLWYIPLPEEALVTPTASCQRRRRRKRRRGPTGLWSWRAHHSTSSSSPTHLPSITIFSASPIDIKKQGSHVLYTIWAQPQLSDWGGFSCANLLSKWTLVHLCVCLAKEDLSCDGIRQKNPNGRELLTGFEHWYSLCYKKSLPAGLVCVCVCVSACECVCICGVCCLFLPFYMVCDCMKSQCVAVIDGWWSYTPLYPSLQPQFYTSTWPTAGTLL